MRFCGFFFAFLTISILVRPQAYLKPSPMGGYEQRITEYIDTLRIVDTHEHFTSPGLLKKSYFLDFMLLLYNYNYNDLLSAGLPDSLFSPLFNQPLSPRQKWRLIEPYWKLSFNTAANRVSLIAARELYGIYDINEMTVDELSAKIKKNYSNDWFNKVLREYCRIDYVIQDGNDPDINEDYIKHVKRFSSWLTVRTKFSIDSLAIKQTDPIYTLDDFVRSMRNEFVNALKDGMVAVKINTAYNRSLSFERVQTETARKIFRTLVNGNEKFSMTYQAARPLQDYMFFALMDLARLHKIPVVFHTGLQAGKGNYITNSNPVLLSNVFLAYPDVKFALFHGSYPYGGELSTLAKNFRNVYIDMNWTYAISPSYAERYLYEWLEAVPAGKIMAFGGDYTCVENVYGELVIARKVISNVLVNKVKDGYLTEPEAKNVARLILRDNAIRFYNLE